MMVFDYAQFILDYPQFASMSESSVTKSFSLACIIGNPIITQFCTDQEQYDIACLVLAHILTLRQNGQTGRVSSAGEGTDSVSLDFNSPQWASYWVQTVYGQEIYQLMLQLLAGGHYVWDGQVPYLSNSMNGSSALGWVIV
jgi:hypothetical protein